MVIMLFKNSVKELKQCLAHSKYLVSVRPLLTCLVSFPDETFSQPNQLLIDSKCMLYSFVILCL